MSQSATQTFGFELIHQSKKSRARVGRIHTPHGIIDTPNFVAVGTNGTIKALDNVLIDQIGIQLMFCNTYHLLLQPGPDVVAKGGGLHQFINRKGPIITDSGGFQVFSLAYGSVASELKSQGSKKIDGSVIKINEEGVLFRSYRDGSKVLLTPETSIEAQKKLGADIIIPFDELPPYHIDRNKLKNSLMRTHRWEKRSLETHLKNPQNQAMYAVIHGGVDKQLREMSCDYLAKLPFDGYAVGGSVGKNKEEMVQMLIDIMPRIPEDKPNHLLGIADIDSLDATIPLGIDTFDSSYPTKAARHGLLFTWGRHVRIKQSIYKEHYGPIDDTCSCYTCKNYSMAYLHHLFKAHEVTALSLSSIHNLHFVVEYMRTARNQILNDMI
ncbi:MAG: Queuine tRNA-ribosyltransferase [Chlamydiia bacterium]|nr:Queuine tRNA-ribosyltransferase [Chlamydiia bacterium]